MIDYSISIPGIGPLDSSTVFVGESPSTNDVYSGMPFAGSSGSKLNDLMTLAGLNRDDIYITLLSKIRPPNDKIDLLETRHPEIYQAQVKETIDEINSLPNVKTIVTLGAHALKSLTGVRGIRNWRGAPCRPVESIKHDCVVIPTYHPKILDLQYTLWVFIVADLMKAKRIQDDGFEFPTWNFITHPTFDQVMDTLNLIQQKGYAIIDVETPHNLLSCIGFAWSRSDAISIPFFYGNGTNYWSFEQEYAIWEKINEVCTTIDLAAQNALFDWRIMYEHNIHLRRPRWDTMLMHHCLYSEMPHGLDTITSIYTDLPFTKKDEDEEKGSVLKAGQEEKHWAYNCFDCISEFWACEELEKELLEENMLPVYKNLYADMLMILFGMNMRGLPVDMTRLAKVQAEYHEMIKQYVESMSKEAGCVIFTEAADQKKYIRDTKNDENAIPSINIASPQQVSTLLFNILSMAPYKGKKTDKKALEALAYKYKSDVPTQILEIRAAKKSLGLFSSENIVDGRAKCEYALHRTNTGRIASRKGRGRGGMNLQNVKVGETRRFFTAEKGHLFVNADQKQAEALIVGWYSKDKAMQALGEGGKSIHVERGKQLYGPDFGKGHPAYRVIKGTVHGGNYGLGPRTFALMTNLPYAEAKIQLDSYHHDFPGIRNVFHKYVKDEIRRCRALYNPFGRREVFLDRIDERLFRAGFAFLPQSTSTDVNKTALKRIAKYYQPLLDTHDGIAISVPEKELMSAVEALKEAYHVEFKIWGETHTIPVEITFGPNWEDQETIDI